MPLWLATNATCPHAIRELGRLNPTSYLLTEKEYTSVFTAFYREIFNMGLLLTVKLPMLTASVAFAESVRWRESADRGRSLCDILAMIVEA